MSDIKERLDKVRALGARRGGKAPWGRGRPGPHKRTSGQSSGIDSGAGVPGRQGTQQ